MDREVSQRELRNDSGSILRAAEEGESFVVTRNGTPVARLIPYERDKAFVSKEELRRSSARVPSIDLDRLRSEMDEYIDQDPFKDPYGRNV